MERWIKDLNLDSTFACRRAFPSGRKLWLEDLCTPQSRVRTPNHITHNDISQHLKHHFRRQHISSYLYIAINTTMNKPVLSAISLTLFNGFSPQLWSPWTLWRLRVNPFVSLLRQTYVHTNKTKLTINDRMFARISVPGYSSRSLLVPSGRSLPRLD